MDLEAGLFTIFECLVDTICSRVSGNTRQIKIIKSVQPEPKKISAQNIQHVRLSSFYFGYLSTCIFNKSSLDANVDSPP